MNDRVTLRPNNIVSPLGELLENLNAPEIYSTASPSFATTLGVLTITFASSRVDNSVSPGVRRQVVVARVSMPMAGAADLVTSLYDFLCKQQFQFASPTEKERPQ